MPPFSSYSSPCRPYPVGSREKVDDLNFLIRSCIIPLWFWDSGFKREFADFFARKFLLRSTKEHQGTMTDTPTEGSTALGIAFGNSTTQIAFNSRTGLPECLANEDGERQIPSTLSYAAGEEYHGGQAKSQLVRNSANTIISFRDWLGHKYSLVDNVDIDIIRSILREQSILRNLLLLLLGM
jgi:hypothetical protein